MRFASFYWAILFLGLPYLFRWRQQQRPATLPHPDLLTKTTNYGQLAAIKRRLPLMLRLLTLGLLILALMRPQKGFLADMTNRYGVDIMVALDVSSSMTAEDFNPNRITVAKQVLADFINGRPNDRIGLVVFGSQSYLQSPLTSDHKTLLALLADVRVGMAEDGTAIGMAIANAVKRLKDSQAKSKLILLLTDGDNNAGAIDPETAARLAATYNIKIYAIGIGNPAGAPIPVLDTLGRKAYARNPDGSVFLTKMNAGSLQKIAEITMGNYFQAADSQKLVKTFQEIDRLEKTKYSAKTPYIFDERFGFFLWPAWLLLVLEYLTIRIWVRPLP